MITRYSREPSWSAITLLLLFALGWWGTIIYVGYHFIAKFW